MCKRCDRILRNRGSREEANDNGPSEGEMRSMLSFSIDKHYTRYERHTLRLPWSKALCPPHDPRYLRFRPGAKGLKRVVLSYSFQAGDVQPFPNQNCVLARACGNRNTSTKESHQSSPLSNPRKSALAFETPAESRKCTFQLPTSVLRLFLDRFILEGQICFPVA